MKRVGEPGKMFEYLLKRLIFQLEIKRLREIYMQVSL